MGPVENNLMTNARVIRQRLKSLQPPKPVQDTIATEVMMAEIKWLRTEVERLSNEVSRLKPNYDTSDLARVIELVAAGERVSKLDLVSKRRSAKVARARQLCYYLAATKTGHSLPKIGRFFNKADHTAVLYGRNKVEMLRLVDPSTDSKLKEYEAKLDQ